MSTGYPASIDSTATLKNDATDATVTSVTHETAHNNVADSLIAIETELGTLPKGSYADTKTRLNDGVYKTPSGAQVIRPSTDIVPFAVRKNTGTDISNLSEWRDHLNVIFAYLDASGVISASGFRVSGTLLNSTHLSDSAALARLASPAFTGTPSAPTAAPGDNTTKLATTAFTTAAIAAASPGVGSITSSMILDGTIVDADVAADTLTARVIAANAIGSSELADNAVDTAAIQDSAITSVKVADSAITSVKILDGTIVDADISGSAALALTKLAHLLLRGPDDTTQLRIAYGHTSGASIGPAPAKTASISFGITFASAPVVFVSPSGVATGSYLLFSVSTTAFVYTVNGNGTDPYDFNWFAIGAA